MVCARAPRRGRRRAGDVADAIPRTREAGIRAVCVKTQVH
jgi:hypothetical protein